MGSTQSSKLLFKDYIAKKLVSDKNLHIKCECIIPFDINGKIVDYEIVNNEIVFLVDVGGKIIKIGENHPKLFIVNDF